MQELSAVARPFVGLLPKLVRIAALPMVMDSARLLPFPDAIFVAALHAALALERMPLRLHEPHSELFELRVVMGRVAAMSPIISFERYRHIANTPRW